MLDFLLLELVLAVLFLHSNYLFPVSYTHLDVYKRQPLYYDLRTKIAINKNDVIGKNKGMAFHPALKDFAQMQQNGDLSVIQNVGYPEPVRSHFRSQEIWQTATDSNKYLNEGWLGRYLDLQCKEHQPTAGINLDSIDNLALKGVEPNSITVKDPNRFKIRSEKEENVKLSDNPQLDFVRKIANSVTEGSDDIQKALSKSTAEISYPKTGLAKNLEWIAPVSYTHLDVYKRQFLH